MKNIIVGLFIIILSLFPSEINAYGLPFIDGDKISPFAKEAVTKYVTEGVLATNTKDNKFYPQRLVTRMEFIKVVLSFKFSNLELEQIKCSNKCNKKYFPVLKKYGDVLDDHWSNAYLAKAISEKLLFGDNNMLKPHKNISKLEALLVLKRIFPIKNIDSTYPNFAYKTIKNEKKLRELGYIDLIKKGKGLAIIVESNDYEKKYFDGDKLLTREEVFAFIFLFDLFRQSQENGACLTEYNKLTRSKIGEKLPKVQIVNKNIYVGNMSIVAQDNYCKGNSGICNHNGPKIYSRTVNKSWTQITLNKTDKAIVCFINNQIKGQLKKIELDLLLIYSQGEENTKKIIEKGKNNKSEIIEKGENNKSEIIEKGENNKSEIIEKGENNKSEIIKVISCAVIGGIATIDKNGVCKVKECKSEYTKSKDGLECLKNNIECGGNRYFGFQSYKHGRYEKCKITKCILADDELVQINDSNECKKKCDSGINRNSDGECITKTYGPVKYEDSQLKIYNYSWYKTGNYGECNNTCGNGQKTEKVVCKDNAGSVLEDSKCNLKDKPKNIISCTNKEGCNPTAKKGCYDGNLYWYNQLNDRGEKLNNCDFGCENGVCKDEKLKYNWDKTTLFGKCDNTCGDGNKTREVLCKDNHGNITDDVNCDGAKESSKSCSDKTQCNSQDHSKCYDEDVYWYNQLGEKKGLRQGCDFGCENDFCKPDPIPSCSSFNSSIYMLIDSKTSNNHYSRLNQYCDFNSNNYCEVPSNGGHSNRYYCSDRGAKYIRINNVDITRNGHIGAITFKLLNKYGTVQETKSASTGNVIFGPYNKSDLIRVFRVETYINNQRLKFDFDIEIN